MSDYEHDKVKIVNIRKKTKSSLIEFDGQGDFCFEYTCGESLNSIFRKMCKAVTEVTTYNPIVNFSYNTETFKLQIRLLDNTIFETERLDIYYSKVNHSHTTTDIINFETEIKNLTTYTHTQSVASSTWIISHGLGFNPAGIKVFDSADTEWFGNINYIDLNTLSIDFNGYSFGGKAYLS